MKPLNNSPLNPVSIYRYKRHDKYGTVWVYLNHDGIEQPDLLYVRKINPEKGRQYITLNKEIGKKSVDSPDQHLYGNVIRKIKKHGKEITTKNVSGIFEPDLKRPGCGYGHINNTRDAILIKRTESEMMIMVFPGQGNNGAVLFTQWGTGGVRESLLSNSLYIPTLSVQADPV